MSSTVMVTVPSKHSSSMYNFLAVWKRSSHPETQTVLTAAGVNERRKSSRRRKGGGRGGWGWLG